MFHTSMDRARPTRRLLLALAVVAAVTSLRAGTALASPAAAPASKAGHGNALNIAFEKYTLPNGLTVILAPDHSTPQATVDVWYHVGLQERGGGPHGLRAHVRARDVHGLRATCPTGLHDRLTEGVGGNNNGSTTNDRTNYYENVPANYLESALWLEADRMGFLLDKLDETKFSAQRDIVKNERRQSARQPAVRTVVRDPLGGDAPGHASVLVVGHRLHGRPAAGDGGRREEFLPSLLLRRPTRRSPSSATSIRRRSSSG